MDTVFHQHNLEVFNLILTTNLRILENRLKTKVLQSQLKYFQKILTTIVLVSLISLTFIPQILNIIVN